MSYQKSYYREDAKVIESWAEECLASQEVLLGGYAYFPAALTLLRGMASVVQQYLPERHKGFDVDRAADLAIAEITLMANQARKELGLL